MTNPAMRVMTVLGPLEAGAIGITDAHNHLWIRPVAGAAADAPQLIDEAAIAAELGDYRRAGGSAIVDCQPGGAGRDGRVLARLSRASGVHVIASTGFHRRHYYGDRAPLWDQSAEGVVATMHSEITDGLAECRDGGEPVRPGVIKIALEATLAETPRHLLEAAAAVCRQTGYAIEAHTEQGASVEMFLSYFLGVGVDPGRLIFCHVDKRPDLALHQTLADADVLLEYDTFYRPKYDPDTNLWPLLEQMVASGYGGSLALATDMADAAFWQRLGGGPGLAGLLTQIRPRLEQIGFDAATIRQLLGGNIISRLALPFPPQRG
jgi:phosphotriesterase-related protein